MGYNTLRYFKGTNAEYISLHEWVIKNKGERPPCVACGSTKNLQWSNISNEYKRDLDDFESLCPSCHKRKDVNGAYDICAAGHKMTPENTYFYPNNANKECKLCRKLRHDEYNYVYNRTRRRELRAQYRASSPR